MENERRPRQSSMMLLNSNTTGTRNWTVDVENPFVQLEFGFVWLNGGVRSKGENEGLLHARLECRKQEK